MRRYPATEDIKESDASNDTFGYQNLSVRKFKTNRYCKYCGKKLSIYNPNRSVCHLHITKDLILRTDKELAKQLQRQRAWHTINDD